MSFYSSEKSKMPLGAKKAYSLFFNAFNLILPPCIPAQHPKRYLAGYGRRYGQVGIVGANLELAFLPRLPNHQPLRLLHDFRGHVGRRFGYPVCYLQAPVYNDAGAGYYSGVTRGLSIKKLPAF